MKRDYIFRKLLFFAVLIGASSTIAMTDLYIENKTTSSIFTKGGFMSGRDVLGSASARAESTEIQAGRKKSGIFG
jgi:hypothetical protein